MSASSRAVTRYGQNRAEREMSSTATFTRAGEKVFNETSGQWETEQVTVYEGRCKVQTFEAHEAEPEGGGARRIVQRYYLHVPVSAGKFLAHDRATITASANPNLVGNVYKIAGGHEKDWQTAQRLLADIDGGPA